MTVQVRVWRLVMALVVGHVYIGAGYLLGPPRVSSSGSLTVAVSWAPIHVWGALFAAGAAIALGTAWLPPKTAAVAHSVAAVPPAAFAVALTQAQVDGTAQGWGGPGLYLIFVAVHGWLAYQHLSGGHSRARLR